MRDILLLEEWELDSECFFFYKIVSQIWYAEPSEFHGLLSCMDLTTTLLFCIKIFESEKQEWTFTTISGYL